MHLRGPDLDLQRLSLRTDHRRVKGLVQVHLRCRDEVLEAPGQGLPERVDHPDRAVAVLDRVDDDAHRGQVVDLVELLALLRHLRIDGVEVLGAARDLGLDANRGQLPAQEGARLRHVGGALDPLLADQLLDLVVLAGMQDLEREILELPLDRVDSQSVRQRCVDLECLARLRQLLLFRHRAQSAHVVQAVGELDQDDPHVGGHRDHHLPVILRLALVAALEGDPGQLGDAVDEMGHLLAETVRDLGETGARVLDRVMEQRSAERLGIEAQAGADLRHLDRMADEFLAGAATLIGVALTGEREGALDLLLVHRIAIAGIVLADHGQQVAEQLALALGQVPCDRVDGSGCNHHAARVDRLRPGSGPTVPEQGRPRRRWRRVKGPSGLRSSALQVFPSLLMGGRKSAIRVGSLQICLHRGYDAQQPGFVA